MISIFTIPKPFSGHIGIIQRNAIQSWFSFGSGCEVILCGNEKGTEEAAQEFKAKMIKEIDCNQYGTPLLPSAFKKVGETAKNKILCYINADIIILDNLVQMVQRIKMNRFLIIGQRWDLDVTESLNFNNRNWQELLLNKLLNEGRVHPAWGSDFFIFSKDSELINLPDFAVGRPGWDNYLIYKARLLRYPVIDASKVFKVVHQNHDYNHLAKVSSQKIKNEWFGPEVEQHHKIVEHDKFFLLLDATHILHQKFLLPALDFKHLVRRWRKLPILFPWFKPIRALLDVSLFKLIKSFIK